MWNRRKFLTIAGAAIATPSIGVAAPLHIERGIAMGAQVTLRFAHPDARDVARAAMVEISRLEDIFSLYRAGSALSRLNAQGHLNAPPPELLECLSLAGAVHATSNGLFDPTVQPLWRAFAGAVERGVPLRDTELNGARARVGWTHVALTPERITLGQGQSLTLNGIAQGYITDRIVAFLEARGLSNLLIDTGELRASGRQPDGAKPWPVTLPSGARYGLESRAIATSAPLGMTLGGQDSRSHILNPVTGTHARSTWRSVSVSAPRAGLADALSTAGCLMGTRAEIQQLCAVFEGAELQEAVVS